MSRIGRNPITLPAGVNAVVNNNEITVSGPLGTLKQKFDSVNVEVKDNIITLTRVNDENEVKAKHGLYRALIANMVKGVKEGFTKNLQIKGVGYKASKSGNNFNWV